MAASFKLALAALTVALLGAGGGLLAYRQLAPATAPAPAEIRSGAPRADFTLRDLQGKEHRASDWDGKVVLLNFWATWCPPCRKEIPTLIELQHRFGARGLQVVGVAIDQAAPVQDLARTLGINYPTLLAEQEGDRLSRRYGNRYGQLPYTVLIDRQQRIALVKRGALDPKEANQAIGELL